MSSRRIVAVEIGSSKIKAAVADVADNGNISLVNIEEERLSPNNVRHGIVQNVKEVSNTLNRIMLKLGNSISPQRVSAVYVGVGGRSTMASIRPVSTTLPNDTEITDEIIASLLGRAENALDADRRVMQVLPGRFIVDNMDVPNPVGTVGNSISTDAMAVSLRHQILRNLQMVITDKLGLKINGYVVRHTAIADMVLSDEERQLGVMLVDFGAETTTVSVYKGGVLCLLVTVPLGSRHITLDIMNLGKYSEERSEELKINHGSAMPGVHEKERMHYDTVIDETEINSYVSARTGEIVINILERIKDAGLESADDLQRGIVVVGGGAELHGFKELLEEQSGRSVRKGLVPTSKVQRESTRIRLSNEDIDVISILHHLASVPTGQCVAAPAPQPETETTAGTDRHDAAKAKRKDDDYDWDDEDQDDQDVERVSGRRRGIFKSIFGEGFGQKIKNIIDPQDQDTSDEEFDN